MSNKQQHRTSASSSSSSTTNALTIQHSGTTRDRIRPSTSTSSTLSIQSTSSTSSSSTILSKKQIISLIFTECLKGNIDQMKLYMNNLKQNYNICITFTTTCQVDSVYIPHTTETTTTISFFTATLLSNSPPIIDYLLHHYNIDIDDLSDLWRLFLWDDIQHSCDDSSSIPMNSFGFLLQHYPIHQVLPNDRLTLPQLIICYLMNNEQLTHLQQLIQQYNLSSQCNSPDIIYHASRTYNRDIMKHIVTFNEPNHLELKIWGSLLSQDWDMILHLLQYKLDPNSSRGVTSGLSLLHHAASSAHVTIDIIDYLIDDVGIDINDETTEDKSTPLSYALGPSTLHIANHLINRGAQLTPNPNQDLQYDVVARIWRSMKINDTTSLNQFIQQINNTIVQRIFIHQLFFYSIKRISEMCHYTIFLFDTYNIARNITDSRGYSILHQLFATLHHDHDCDELDDHDIYPAIMKFIQHFKPTPIEMEYKCRINQLSWSWYGTPLLSALMSSYECNEISYIQCLIKKFGANFYDVDGFGNNILHVLCCIGQSRSVSNEFLYLKSMLHYCSQLGIDINDVNDNNQTPLHYAVRYQNSGFIQCLLHNKSNINLIDIDGNTI